MTTITRQHLKIIQTRPNVDVPWYNLTTSWQYAWIEFNKYDEEVTEVVDGVSTTKLERRQKYSLIPFIKDSDDGLTRTRTYYEMLPSVHDEFVALLNDDDSDLSDERRYDAAYGITYELVSEEIVREIVEPIVEPEETTP